MAHLAPTLRHLEVVSYKYAANIEQLTKLEVFTVWHGIPTNCFQAVGDLPLKLLMFNPSSSKRFYDDPRGWAFTPTTLTRLTLKAPQYIPPDVLPASITHLQLTYADGEVVQQAAVALPGLLLLDVHLYRNDSRGLHTKLCHISEFHHLETLGMCIVDGIRSMQRQEVLSSFPDVAQAVDRGVMLNCMESVEEMLGVLADPCPRWSEWTTYAQV